MTKQLFLAVMLICILGGCASVLPPNYKELTDSMMNADNNMKKINLGMTKEQVIAIMGEHYEVIGSKEGEFLLGYKSYDYGIYKLRFVNGRLTDWIKDWLPEYRDKDTSQNTSMTNNVQNHKTRHNC